ncbi:hypothetical protein R5R35_008332 [Gryllus longicercus]|uniref:Solute carrier family 25 member 46 n=1 Tax=Gryllus longicercus TaxID=2509291 RepID=A0AAN9V1I9_9ORTH
MAGMERYPSYVGDKDLWNRRFDSLAGGDVPRPSLELNSRLPARVQDESDQDEDGMVKRYVGMGVSLASLITENLLSHPFVVLRRQCQVHNNSRRYHLIPVTLLPVIIHLHRRQGITTLWKGLGSVLMVRGMSLAVEDLISKVTPWPKDVSWHSSFKAFGQHVLLKCCSLAIVTPFYSASLVETVQSDIASEKPGIFDVFKEGLCRLLSWGAPQKGRMLPIWSLVIPTVTYGLIKYFLTITVRGLARRIMIKNHKEGQQKQGALSRDISQPVQDIELNSSLIAFFTAEVAFYPLETILHRLHLQGTRTIIDNLDSGYEVIPILTSYEGARDCYDTTLQQEGVCGLYKGFGSLLLQFAAHFAVIKLTNLVLTEVTNLLRSGSKPSVPQTDLGNVQRTVISNIDSPVSHSEAADYSFGHKTYP